MHLEMRKIKWTLIVLAAITACQAPVKNETKAKETYRFQVNKAKVLQLHVTRNFA
jgi:hypothetical protein